MTDVLTALSLRHDAAVSLALGTAAGLSIGRRCADLAELLSVAESGGGNWAVVSADLRGLDLSTVRTLAAAGLVVIGIFDVGDDGAERRLRQLGVDAVLSADADASAFTDLHASRHDAQGAHDQASPTDSEGQPSAAGDDRLPAETDPDGSETGSGWLPSGIEAPVGVSADPRAVEGTAEGEEPSGPGRVIAVWGPAGSPGRTTVAVNLAAELAKRGRRVLLIDADTYGASIAQSLAMLDEAPGVAAASRSAEAGTLDVLALARLAPEVIARLRVLTGLPRPDRWPELRAAALERIIELARQVAEVVVIDCGFCLEDDEELSYDTAAPRRNEATLTSLAAAQEVVAVGGCDPVALGRLVRAVQELGTVSSPEPRIVINRVRASAVGSSPESKVTEALDRFAGLTDISFLPEARDIVDAALLEGRSVVEHAPDSALGQGFSALADRLVPAKRPRSPRRGKRLLGRRKAASGT